MAEGYEIPLHRSLTEPILMAGAPRTAAIAIGTLAAAVGLGTALLQLGGTVSPILSGAQVESRKRILPYAITVGSMMRVMVLVLAIAAWTLEGTALLVVTLASFLLLGFFSGAQRVAFQMLMAKLIPIDRRGRRKR